MTLTSQEQHINYLRIEQAIKYLEKNFLKQPELEDIAESVQLSPYHFQRLFTEWAGISPKRFLQYLTIDFLKEKLQQSISILEAAEAAGLSSQSRVYDLFTTLEAVTPQEYKLKGSGITITYGFHPTLFGNCLIGVTERGICWISFLSSNEEMNHALDEMKMHWYNSIFREDVHSTAPFITRIFNDQPEKKKLHLLVRGTNFQIKVWEALLRIPSGTVTTYKEIAKAVQSPKAMQAVGTAVGSNHIAYLIPCHRVIRKDGILGEYRWSSHRKKSIIGWEMAKQDATH
jgi:AraC family transcriptional regulator, regulatory protein of adaptative response / methylated-DNA-[protein]-cysteine methyltransferase